MPSALIVTCASWEGRGGFALTNEGASTNEAASTHEATSATEGAVRAGVGARSRGGSCCREHATSTSAAQTLIGDGAWVPASLRRPPLERRASRGTWDRTARRRGRPRKAAGSCP